MKSKGKFKTKKGNFVKPVAQVQNEIVPTLTNLGTRAGGAVLFGMLLSKFGDKLGKTFGKFSSVILYLLTAAGEAFVNQPMVQQALNGANTTALINLLGDPVIVGQASKMGITLPTFQSNVSSPAIKGIGLTPEMERELQEAAAKLKERYETAMEGVDVTLNDDNENLTSLVG